MKKRIIISTIAAVLAACATIIGGFAMKNVSLASENEVKDVITVVSPSQRSTVRLDSEKATDFFRHYKFNYGVTFMGQGDVFGMKDLTLKWTCENGAYYNVFIDTTARFTNAEKYTVVKPELTLENLLPETDYYWKVRVTDQSGNQTFSKVYNFKTKGYIRAVNIEGVSNSRDLGGAKTTDGKTLKYGLVYRSANLDVITEKGKKQFAKLGIKTDMDLRGESLTKSPAGENVKIINFQAPWYADGSETSIIGAESYRNAFRDEIKYFANADNYPVIFHCAIGRDRTGTLAVFLQAICGVDRESIIREYEFSYLSEAGSTGENPNAAYFVTGLCNFIEEQEGDSFQAKAINFLKTIGVTDQDVSAIQNIMVG